MIADYHIHTPYCGHAHGVIIDYVEKAIKSGMQEICFTDHLGRYYLTPYQKKRYWDWGMDQTTLERYYTELLNIRSVYNDQIPIRIGLEIDYIEGAEDILLPILENYAFDFLLGSIHCLPSFGWHHLASYSKKDIWPIFDKYLQTAESAIQAKIFDSLAHLDFIWRYSKWPAKKTEDIFASMENIVKTIAKNEMAIEINSNGYLWSQIYNIPGGDPFMVLVDNIHKYDAPITIGSDAHKPEFVGKAFVELAKLLKTKGITKYCTFKQRKKIEYPITE